MSLHLTFLLSDILVKLMRGIQTHFALKLLCYFRLSSLGCSLRNRFNAQARLYEADVWTGRVRRGGGEIHEIRQIDIPIWRADSVGC